MDVARRMRLAAAEKRRLRSRSAAPQQDEAVSEDRAVAHNIETLRASVGIPGRI
jgi:hypothetical protein